MSGEKCYGRTDPDLTGSPDREDLGISQYVESTG